MFWFSTPALMKEWQDRSLTHILHGKVFKTNCFAFVSSNVLSWCFLVIIYRLSNHFSVKIFRTNKNLIISFLWAYF
ncbi:hypothetical protein [Helicobacter bilis]|uniref:hypothetical protein n=1 Tax=Helicobacter bilis TaxID=37372 RepID=UPI0020C2D978|nr:hypothetical protein [Helicobacter bilis]